MKSLTEHMAEAIGKPGTTNINEAKRCVINTIPECPENGEEYEVQPAIDKCYEIASAFEDSIKNMKLLKKVKAFKDYNPRELNDLAVCLEQIGGYINGLMSLAEDDVAEASMYVGQVQDMVDGGDVWDNCPENVDPADFDAISDDEDIYDYFESIKNNWNDICKAIFGMPWD